tara:strand:+ start:462 stop:986 length:525 start_codon:yes stop_codon:yes gene_type:complete
MEPSCWVLTERSWPYKIKAASDSWFSLWKYSKEEAINRPIGMIQHGANEYAASMLMRRYFQHDKRGTACANADKRGQLYSHVAYLVPHEAGLLCVSTQFKPRRRLTIHEKFQDAHDARPHLGSAVLVSVLEDVLMHVRDDTLTHEQRFLLHRAHQVVARNTRPGMDFFQKKIST